MGWDVRLLLIGLLPSAYGGGRAWEPPIVRVVITGVDSPNQDCAPGYPGPCAALSELSLNDENGTRLPVQEIFQDPPGDNVNGLTPNQLLDNQTSTTWLDYGFANRSSSTLMLVLQPGAPRPAQLELTTAKDASKRDPISWRVELMTICGGWAEIGSWRDFDSAGRPLDRRTNYATRNGGAPFHLQEAPYRENTYCDTSTMFRFVFTETRGCAICGGWGGVGVQLAEVFLFGLDGQKLQPLAASNPGRYAAVEQYQNTMQSAAMAIDGNNGTKFLDLSLEPGSGRSATLQLELPNLTIVGSYTFRKAWDTPGRDPTAWRFERLKHDGSWETTAVVRGIAPPDDFLSLYPTFYGTGPPPSPPPPVVPPSPPAPPTGPPPPPSGDTYEFVFSEVRGKTPTCPTSCTAGQCMHTFNCYQLQLAEIRLFTEDGLATIVDAGNPGGWSAGNIQGPTAVFDDDLDTKWVDANFTKPSGEVSPAATRTHSLG